MEFSVWHFWRMESAPSPWIKFLLISFMVLVEVKKSIFCGNEPSKLYTLVH